MICKLVIVSDVLLVRDVEIVAGEIRDCDDAVEAEADRTCWKARRLICFS